MAPGPVRASSEVVYSPMARGRSSRSTIRIAYPSEVFTTVLNSPGATTLRASRKSGLSLEGSIFPSDPPCFPVGSIETFDAKVPKSAPFFSSSRIRSASVSESTTMIRMEILAEGSACEADAEASNFGASAGSANAAPAAIAPRRRIERRFNVAGFMGESSPARMTVDAYFHSLKA